MNILVFSWRDPKHPLAGGAEQVMHQHMLGWIKAGYKVTLFSSRFKGSLQEEEIEGVKIVRSGCQNLGVQLKALIFYLKHKSHFDLVVDEFHGLPFFTPLFVKKPRLAVIQEIAREVWFLNPLPFPFNLITGTVGYLLEPLFFLFYKNTYFMTGSNSAKVDVISFGIPEKYIYVVPHGVNTLRLSPFLRKEEIPTISFLGILSKDKGIEDALKCFAILNEKGNYQFWVIGRPENTEYGRKITQLTKDLGLEEKVKFWGFVSQKMKFNLLARSHLLVNPSIREGWGLVNIEANSVGTPVIGYPSQGLVDSISNGKSGVIVLTNTPESLSEGVERVLQDQKLYQNLKEGSVAWSKEFSWENSKSESLNLLESIAVKK